MKSQSMITGRRNTVLATVIGAVLASYAGGAAALDWQLDNGATINWNTTLSVGSSWRAEDPSKLLYTKADGSLIGKTDGVAGNHAGDIGDLNYAKGDIISLPFKLITDVEFKKGKFGFLVRAKAWYDEALKNNDVRIGNGANGFNGTIIPGPEGPTGPNCYPNNPNYPPGNILGCIPLSSAGHNVWPKDNLSDQNFDALQKFDNVYLLDAYVYGSVGLGNTDLQMRLGNQVINWGESVFIQGVNQFNPIDVPAARRAGSELKEILLPVWAAYINWGLPVGSLEAFYQLKWTPTAVDTCDTYWNGGHGAVSVHPGHCATLTAVNYGSTYSAPLPQFGSEPFAQATGQYVPLVKGVEASDSGQYGFAYRFPVEKLDTEFGLYWENIHARTPNAQLIMGTQVAGLSPTDYAILKTFQLLNAAGTAYTGNLYNPIPLIAGLATVVPEYYGAPGVQINPETGRLVYPEDLHLYGLSAATNLFGWSTSAELSYQANVPVSINGNDLLTASLTGLGPMGPRAAAAFAKAAQAQATGTGQAVYLNGWDRFDKTQFQFNTIKTFNRVLWADSFAFVGEVGFQWNNVPDYKKTGSIRYGRNSVYGFADGPWMAQQLPPIPGLSTCDASLLTNPALAPLKGLYNSSPKGCKNNGFVTDFAWGYRLRVNADYYNVFGSGITVTPSLYWADDVQGVSMDPTFNEGRHVLGAGLKFNYNKKYTVDLNYQTYANNTYDPTFDRDFYSIAASVTF
jgi:hypothetical protein